MDENVAFSFKNNVQFKKKKYNTYRQKILEQFVHLLYCNLKFDGILLSHP